MASLFTVISDVPALIGGLTSAVTLIEKILPEAETDAAAIWTAVKASCVSLKADFEAMTAGGFHLMTVVQDVPKLVADASGLVGQLGTVISTIEADATSIWAEVLPTVTGLKANLSDLVGSAPAAS